MGFQNAVIVTVAFIGLMAATGTKAATVNIMVEAGDDYRTRYGIREDTVTRGADLVGMEVSVVYADGTAEELVWAEIGGGAGRVFGVTGIGMGLTSDWYSMELTASSNLRSLTMNAATANSMFDILPANVADTYSTKWGYDFEISGSDTYVGEIDVTYSNQIVYRQEEAVGDIFTTMTVDFSGLWGGGLLGDLSFRTDMDTLAVDGDLTPVPLPGGLPLLASSFIVLGLARRMRHQFVNNLLIGKTSLFRR